MGRTKTTVEQKLNKISHDLREISILYSMGHTDEEVAQVLGITEVTINNWKKDEKFLLALKKGKQFADEKVEQSLYKRAIGYEYDEVTYEQSKTGGLGIKLTEGEVSEMKHTPTTKTKVVTKAVHPDTTAQIFWLKNRKSDEWRDRQDIDINRSYTKKIIHELKGLDAGAIRSLAVSLRESTGSERPVQSN